jgi:hypothetical protein
MKFYQNGGGTPNPFTVSQMPFFRSFISKVCRINKVSEGINKMEALLYFINLWSGNISIDIPGVL